MHGHSENQNKTKNKFLLKKKKRRKNSKNLHNKRYKNRDTQTKTHTSNSTKHTKIKTKHTITSTQNISFKHYQTKMASIQVDLSAGPSHNELPAEQINLPETNENDMMDITTNLDNAEENLELDYIDNINIIDDDLDDSGLVIDIPLDDPPVSENDEPASDNETNNGTEVENEAAAAVKNDDQQQCHNCICNAKRPVIKTQFKRQVKVKQRSDLDQNWRTVTTRSRIASSFNDKRNIWYAQERQSAHKRIPKHNSPLDIRVRVSVLSGNLKRELRTSSARVICKGFDKSCT